ncbi:hypothetical protein SAY86_025786 [Trapa natans]|uniref:Uncharacterized protein n=1 Tax=Trapa natans TaxID=22666 RepID=A0AAN7KD31_TRANT|nr:hypothetical protein SAY86_025786 [Trapa natans]
MDDPPAVRLRHELPHRQVPASPEQDHGNGGDLCGGAGLPHHLQLAPDAEAGMGPGRGCRSPQRLLGGYRGCSARLHLQRHMRPGLGGVLMEGLPQPLELRAAVPCLRRHALLGGLVFHGTDLICRIFEERRGFCGCPVHLHEHLGVDSDGGPWDECCDKCEGIE